MEFVIHSENRIPTKRLNIRCREQRLSARTLLRKGTCMPAPMLPLWTAFSNKYVKSFIVTRVRYPASALPSPKIRGGLEQNPVDYAMRNTQFLGFELCLILGRSGLQRDVIARTRVDLPRQIRISTNRTLPRSAGYRSGHRTSSPSNSHSSVGSVRRSAC